MRWVEKIREGRKGVLMRLENVDVRKFGRESSSPSPSSYTGDWCNG